MAKKSKPRFECDVCDVDRETVRCNGEGCEVQVCLDCLGRHEGECIERNGDRRATAVCWRSEWIAFSTTIAGQSSNSC